MKTYSITIAIIIIIFLCLFNIKLNVSSNATATSNSKALAISKAISQSISTSSATSNTYIVNYKVKKLLWKHNIHTNIFTKRCNGFNFLYTGWCIYGNWIITKVNPAILEIYMKKPLPWMQRYFVIDDKLHVFYWDNRRNK